MWKTKIEFLESVGMTQAEIAESIGASQSYVNALKSGKRGKRIGNEIAERLTALHKKIQRRVKK